jgi:hypothetical protein
VIDKTYKSTIDSLYESGEPEGETVHAS